MKSAKKEEKFLSKNHFIFKMAIASKLNNKKRDYLCFKKIFFKSSKL